jgi:hypothetical protein
MFSSLDKGEQHVIDPGHGSPNSCVLADES